MAVTFIRIPQRVNTLMRNRDLDQIIADLLGVLRYQGLASPTSIHMGHITQYT